MEWKKNRTAKQEAEKELKQKAKEAAYKAGKGQGMSGRDLFTFNPELAEQVGEYDDDDDDDVFDISQYRRDDGQENQSDKDANMYNGDGSTGSNSNATQAVVVEDGVAVREDLFAAENLDDLDDLDD
jgi:hypothetical protein